MNELAQALTGESAAAPAVHSRSGGNTVRTIFVR